MQKQLQKQQQQQLRMKDGGVIASLAKHRTSADQVDADITGTFEAEGDDVKKTSTESEKSAPNTFASKTTTALSANAVQRIQAAAAEASCGDDLSKINLWSTAHRWCAHCRDESLLVLVNSCVSV
jgi:NADH pyrophosphatase NudC (nudix superfamily)